MNEYDPSKLNGGTDDSERAPAHFEITHPRLWLATAIVCIAITVAFSVAILVSNHHTQGKIDRIDRIIVQGADANGIATVMHQVTLTRRDGTQVQLDVSGTATPEQVTDFMSTFFAGEDVPPTWKVTEWTIAGGGTIKVTTPPKPGEVPGGPVHCDRHDSFVAELQERFPPV